VKITDRRQNDRNSFKDQKMKIRGITQQTTKPECLGVMIFHYLFSELLSGSISQLVLPNPHLPLIALNNYKTPGNPSQLAFIIPIITKVTPTKPLTILPKVPILNFIY
jgi:hypothetical protein